MPGSDTGSSTIHQDQYLDVVTKEEDEKLSESQEKQSIERVSIEPRSSKEEDSKSDLETGAAAPPSIPPGFNPADFPDGGLEAVSLFLQAQILVYDGCGSCRGRCLLPFSAFCPKLFSCRLP